MAAITFVKTGTRVTFTNEDGKIYGLTGYLNVLPHPNNENYIILSQEVDPIKVLNGFGNGIVVDGSKSTTPAWTDRNAFITALQSIFS